VETTPRKKIKIDLKSMHQSEALAIGITFNAATIARQYQARLASLEKLKDKYPKEYETCHTLFVQTVNILEVLSANGLMNIALLVQRDILSLAALEDELRVLIKKPEMIPLVLKELSAIVNGCEFAPDEVPLDLSKYH
jgi:hypothetical protein